MEPLLEILEFTGRWTWWVVAGVLLLLELLAPGVFFLWLGVAAMIVGTVVLFVDLSWQWQVASFAVLSIVTLFLSRRLFAPTAIDSDQPNLNKRIQLYIGKTYVLDEPVVNGQGRLKIGDSLWAIAGPDAAAGQKVTVTGIEGATLTVSKAHDEPTDSPD